MRVLRGQALDLRGGRGVTGLGLLRLGHAEGLEEDDLQLLRARQVEGGVTGQLAGGGLLLLHLVEEGRQLLLERPDVHRDARRLHPGEDPGERDLQVAVELVGGDLLQLDGQFLGELEHRGRGVHQGGVPQQGELVLRLRELTLQVPLVDVLELVGALARAQEVGGDGGVVDHALQRHAAAGEHVERRLRLMQVLRVLRRQPRGQGLLIGRGEISHLGAHGVPFRVDDRHRRHVTLVRGTVTDHVHRQPLPGAGGQPLGEGCGVHGDVDKLPGGLLDGALGGDGGQHALPEVGAELEVVETGGDLRDVRRTQRQLIRADGQLHVGEHVGELAVELHLVEPLPEVVADLAADLIGVVEEVGEGAVLLDPLGGGLLADTRDVGQVVGRVAAQSREVRVLLRGEAVLLLHGRRREAVQVGHAAHRVEHGDVVVDQLEVVTVTGDDERLVAERLSRGGERGEDVVGLVVLHAQRLDAECLQHLLEDVHLTLELRRGGLALGLVLREHLGAEGLAAHVEGDGDVARLFLGENVRQHGEEAVDGVGVLAPGRREVLGGEGVEGTERHGVAVDEQQAVVLSHAVPV